MENINRKHRTLTGEAPVLVLEAAHGTEGKVQRNEAGRVLERKVCGNGCKGSEESGVTKWQCRGMSEE
jgi:hypothetical protein